VSALASTGAELRRFRRGTLPKVAILALVLIPLLYGALYLWAFWDPTGRMDRLPVALVNADRTATMSDGTPTHAGQDVVDTLLADGSLDWVTTDAADAEQGVKDGRYYFAVTLPEDFSEAVVSAGGDQPHQARIDVTYNDSNSFLASTLGHSAMVQVDDAVRDTIGAKAVDQVLVGLGSARDGFATAADGAVTLQDAMAQLAAGATSLTAGADTAHSGAAQLASGASKAATGASALSTGLSKAATGASALSDGAAKAAAGAGSLSDGATKAAAGAGSLATGATTLAGGLDQAAAGATALDHGAAGVSAGVDSAVATIGELSTKLSTAPAALTDVAHYLGAKAQGGDTAAAAALQEIQAVAAGLGSVDMAQTSAQLAQLQAGAHQVAGGAATLDASMGRLDAGAHGVASGASDLATGTAQLSAGAKDLAGGTAQLAAGAKDLVGGAGQLSAGAKDLATGTAQLATGTSQLSAGTADLASGAHQLADGSTQLDAGAGTLASGLQDGTKAIPADTDAQRTARGGVIATPVSLTEQHLTKAEGFGEGFAPFFISLALFVGALITYLMLRPLPNRALATPASGWRAALGGFLPAAYLALAQVAVMLVVIHVGVGLNMSTALGTAAFTALIALSFVALQQMINAVFGSAPGKVIILALLMLQLASSGGTYPVETTPAFFRAIHPLLPMSYSVQGLREVVTGGVDGRLWASVAVLGVMLVGSLAITAWRAGRMRTWTLSRLHPAISL
jgi:putative membrane protein